jgi:hypothetical protein
VGPICQQEERKKIKREAGTWAATGSGWWAAGPERRGGKFLFFLFQTPFKSIFKLKFKSNSF